VPKDDAQTPPEAADDPTHDDAASVKDRTVAAAKRARDAVGSAKTTAKESAIEAFDKVIDSLDSLGRKRD
jgi:hypothetical protein